MDDKVYDLLERLYIDMQEMNSRILNVESNMATKEDIMLTRQDIVRLENKMDINHKGLYDGYKQSIEGINDLREELDTLTHKVDNQEIKLQVLESIK